MNFKFQPFLSPAKDTFRIGDTISIVSTFSENVYELKTERTYSLIDFNFFPETSLRKWDIQQDTLSIDYGALSNFEVLIDNKYNYEQSNFGEGVISLVGQYLNQNGEYDLKYQFIPQEVGLFWLAQSSCLIALGEGQDFPGKCPKHDSNVQVQMNGGGGS